MYSSIRGKHVLFLGSSVTYGSAAGGVSFVESLADQAGITYVKEAVSGTTLVDNGPESYVERLINNVDRSKKFDFAVIQLSTNDATQGLELGTISDSRELSDFNTKTILGAIEYIIAYCRNTWGCPVFLYTNTKYDSKAYEAMARALVAVKDKWGIGIIDLWNELSTNIPEYQTYMADSIHPTRIGYDKRWVPFFAEKLS